MQTAPPIYSFHLLWSNSLIQLFPETLDVDELAFFFLLLAAVLFLAAPIFALIAFVRVQQAERRIEALERMLIEAFGTPDQPAAPAPTPTLPKEPAAAPRAAPSRKGIDLETMIAGRWLNRVGIVALLIALAFFLKYAFDNDWIGPRGRVAIGLLIGAGLLVFSQWLLKRGYRYFSDGMAGLGAGALYLSLFAAWDFYHLIPNGVAFAGMIVVTASMTAIAVGRNSQSIAFLALLGGFLTPTLLSTGRDAQVVLFTYIAILNAGLLALAWVRNWRVLALAAFVGTTIYYWTWAEAYYSSEKLLRTAFFAALFFVEFAAVPVIRARREAKLFVEQVVLVLLNASSYLLALHVLLYQDHRWTLTAAVLALAALHLLVIQGLSRTEEPSAARLLFAGLALTFVTLAIPIRLEGKWITMAWAIEGAVLVWSGFRVNLRWLRRAGLLLLGIAASRLFLFPIDAERFVLNPRFATLAVVIACLVMAIGSSRKSDKLLSAGERRLFGLVGFVVNLLTVWTLSMEVWELFGRMQPDVGIDPELAQQLALSLLWTVYATALIVVGVRRENSAFRWQGLSLFGLVVGKVFLYDLASLERAYRIVSFLVLGALLLAVSFLYQRKPATPEAEEKN